MSHIYGEYKYDHVGEILPKRKTTDEFIKESKLIYGNKFNYSEVHYTNNLSKVKIICKKHGEFLTSPSAHLFHNRGCLYCDGKYTSEKFIHLSKLIHKDKYNYSYVDFQAVKVKVILTCKTHGNFLITPDKHINAKQGCRQCAKNYKKSTPYVKQQGAIVHNNKYNYSKVHFVRMFEKIIIICPTHGEFRQTPANHINQKQGCRRCSLGKSKKETEWLDSINLPNDSIHRSVRLSIINAYVIVDGYDPKTNTVYEFNGDYWHGNPKRFDREKVNYKNGRTFGDLYDETLLRENRIRSAGYTVISVWEHDYDKYKKKWNKVMATYLYKCETHGEFEAEHSFAEKLEHCPSCDEVGITTPVVRLIAGGTNFVLKGSCWAKDNYS